MPPGLICLHEAEVDGGANSDELVDIVAVHGLSDDSIEAWTDPDVDINWLRDLLPKHVKPARILTYGYDASPALFLSNGAPLAIQRSAECLVQELYADRKLSNALERPIIFVCHGLGGIVVKKSLIYSSMRTAAKVGHLWDQFVSTFAILFFGTPHDHTRRSSWQALDKSSSSSPRLNMLHRDRLSQSTGEDEIFFQPITAEFSPIMKQFHLFFFWEELRTAWGHDSKYIVDPSSAVIDADNTEKAGIHATHSRMIKFNSEAMPGFRTVVEAIQRYSRDAPRAISHRWSQAIPALETRRLDGSPESDGLTFDVHSGNPLLPKNVSVKRGTISHFYPPQDATSDFIGRGNMLLSLHEALFVRGQRMPPPPRRKSFIIFGLGGSGKTQFCSKFAEDHRTEYAHVFTIHAASSDTIKDSFCKIAKLGGLESTETAGRHYLSQLSDTWLLVIDNADDPALNLQDLFGPGDCAHILVSTRNPDFRQAGSLGSLELKGLEENDAIQLLLTKAYIQRPWDAPTINAGKAIARTLGYLALALIHAGNCIYRQICELGEYLDLHAASRSKLRRRTPSTTCESEEGNIITEVYSTFDMSLTYLRRGKSTKAQDASDLLKIISFYHFEHIPVEIFTRAVFNRAKATKPITNKSFKSRMLAAITDRMQPPPIFPRFLKDQHDQLDKYRVTYAIGELKSLSLISYDGKERNRTLSMHPLVHAFSATRLRIAKLFQPTLLYLVQEQILHSAKCGYVFATRGRFEEAANRLQMVKDSLLQLLGGEHERSMEAMLGLAGVLWGLGRLEEAITLQRQVVDTRTRLYGPQHEQTIQAMGRLGKSHWLHGQYQEALEIQQTTVQLAKAKLGETHALKLEALDNLGVTLASWHRYEESAQAHREVLSVRQTVLGDTHPDTLMTMSNLAMAILDLGDAEEASKLMSTVHGSLLSGKDIRQARPP
ncbi:hypothetical protein NUW58_g1058 [Xylaria curta]|uniref:Uncharacterized protein n=1 Tax=Xylaria curta TaxID=42375 RepID=A0ACC1PPM2_9PEZI|nr:hypothetical protein NUW58_g1058 [Xylaria curta]